MGIRLEIALYLPYILADIKHCSKWQGHDKLVFHVGSKFVYGTAGKCYSDFICYLLVIDTKNAGPRCLLQSSIIANQIHGINQGLHDCHNRATSVWKTNVCYTPESAAEANMHINLPHRMVIFSFEIVIFNRWRCVLSRSMTAPVGKVLQRTWQACHWNQLLNHSQQCQQNNAWNV